MRVLSIILLVAAVVPVRAQARLVPMVGFDFEEGGTIGLGYDVPLTPRASAVVVAVRPSAEYTEVGGGRRSGLRTNGDVVNRIVLSGLGFVPYGKVGAVAEFSRSARGGVGLGVSYGTGVEVRRAFVEFSGALHSAISQVRVAVGYRL